MRFAKRRADWQLGRWTAKHAVAACLQLPADLPSLASIEVRPSPVRRPGNLSRKQVGARYDFAQPSRGKGGLCGCNLPQCAGLRSGGHRAPQRRFYRRLFRDRGAGAGGASRSGGSALAGDSALEREGERPEGAARWTSPRYSTCDRHSRRCATEPKTRKEKCACQRSISTTRISPLDSRTPSMAGVLCAFVTSMIKPSLAGGNTPGTCCGPWLPPRHRRVRSS